MNWYPFSMDKTEVNMVYKFKDIMDENLIENSRVLIVCGSNEIFNSFYRDKCRNLSSGMLEARELDGFDEFKGSTIVDDMQRLEFKDFVTYSKSRRMVGKWYCTLTYDNLVKKDVEKVMHYLRYTNEHGLLVLSVLDWKVIKKLKNDRFITTNKQVNLIDLSWPDRKTLEVFLPLVFDKRGVKLERVALQLFISRMGNNYKDYKLQIDRICEGNKDTTVGFDSMQNYLSGVVNYVMEDFVLSLLKPVKKDKVVKNRKAYKILKMLVGDLGYSGVIRRLNNMVQQYIEYRLAINDGTLPIMVRYSVKEVQRKLPDSYRIKKVTDIQFRKSARIANMTSLKDWEIIRILLLTGQRASEAECLKILLSIIHRAVYNEDRLYNLLKMKDTLEEGLYDLNIRKVVDDIGKQDITSYLSE